ncbi:MAG TPA: SMC-Scp complex subunit ScpB [Phycisphaerae bacterium]|nr:SMC-Scp complex subunit ScpB [Phycisphaerae bacterium]
MDDSADPHARKVAGENAAAHKAAPADQEAVAPDAEVLATVEALLFAGDGPLQAGKIAQVAQLPSRTVREAVRALNARYDQIGSAFRIEEIADGYQMLTLGQYHDVLARLFQARSETRLSQAAMETLAIVAYRQPILRADVEAIRGVACGEVIRGLMDKQLVRIVGRAQVLGRPLLYGTTKRFLELFGLKSLSDLPKAEEFRKPSGEKDTDNQAPEQVPAAPVEDGSYVSGKQVIPEEKVDDSVR